MNKAQLSIQFNWIFVLIVGSALLAMILAFAFNYQDVSDDRISAQLSEQFETIFSATLQQPGTGKEYRSPNLELEFVCDTRQDLHHYKVGGIVARETPFDLIASAPTIETTSLQTFALEWAVPFPVDTFLYLTSPRQEFLFYTATNEGDSLVPAVAAVLDLYPRNFSHRVVYADTPTDLSGRNNDVYTAIIFVGDYTDPNFNALAHPDYFDEIADEVNIIVVDPGNNGLYREGSVTFLTYGEYSDYYSNSLTSAEINSRTERYIGEAALFAAFFSRSQERYACVMNQAFERLVMVSRILELQTQALNESALSEDCQPLVVGIDMPGGYGAQYLVKDIAEAAENGFSKATSQEIFGYTQSLESVHSEIAVETACPLLY
jgi:hypothetical protein